MNGAGGALVAEREARPGHRHRRTGRGGEGHAGPPHRRACSACLIWIPGCCIAPSAGACWMLAATRPTRRRPKRRRARLRPADLERGDLRGPVADAAAAAVAAIPAVRAALLDFQRDFATERGAVLDGRDIGTVIFPDAPVKLFVTASLAERARRRWLELQAQGHRRRPRHCRGGDAGARHAATRPICAGRRCHAARHHAPGCRGGLRRR